MKWFKYIGFGLLIAAFVAYLGWALKLSIQTYNGHVCKKTSIRWKHQEPERNLIEAEDIQQMLSHELSLSMGRKLKKIPIHRIEKKLETRSEIENAEVYTNQSGELILQITPSKVIATVFDARQQQFYLDAGGKVIVAGKNRSACVPTVSGAIYYPFEQVQNVHKFAELHPSAQHKWFVHLHRLILHIAASEFWSKEIQQIQVVRNEDIRLFMRSHDCMVKLGTLDQFEYKLKKLQAFYKKGFAQVGWNKYETIDLQYSNQLVCKKKEHYGE